MIDRMIGASRLNPRVYEELEADTAATMQAALVVVLVGLLAGLGTALGLVLFDPDVLAGIPGGAIGIILIQVISALIGWGVWALITYVVGTAIFEGTADWSELLRTLGFAQSPGVLNFLSFIPILGGLIAALVWLWQLFAGLIGVRQALDFSTRDAVLTILVGWIIRVVLNVFVTFGSASLGGII